MRNLIIIRPTVIFGPGNRGNVLNLLNQISRKNLLMIGSGRNIKSMAYVANVTAFIIFATKHSTGLQIYNYVDKPDLDMNDLIKICRSYMFGQDNVGLRIPVGIGLFAGYFCDLLAFFLRRPLVLSSIRVKKFIGTTQFDSRVSETSFVAKYSLEEALRKTLDHEFGGKVKEGPQS